jgi:anti-sigma28 factor (negative regulator of flagellin synthesis)
MSDESAESEESALTDEEWALVESAQQKLEGEEEELTPAEAAAVEKAIESGELEVESE